MQSTTSLTINSDHLTDEALTLVTSLLEERGNTLSSLHKKALEQLMRLFAGYAAGSTGGRVAFPMPTGMGKTTGVVAFIAAMHRMGYRVPVAVAASRVQALITLRQELLALGVPEADIGIAHSDKTADVPSTGCSPADGRLVQLVTHARVRMGSDYLGLTQQFEGQPRALLVYDETMFRSDAFALTALSVRAAVEGLAPFAEGRPDLAPAVDYLRGAVGAIQQRLGETSRLGHAGGLALELPEVHTEVLERWKTVLGRSGRPRSDVEVLQQLLEVSQLPLQVLAMPGGGGAVALRAAVSDQLENVVILDASAPVRQLVALDPSVRLYSPMPENLKSFENVEVMQVLAAGGRTSIEQGFSESRTETSKAAREVVAMVADELSQDPSRCFLVFTFKRSTIKALDMQGSLKAALKEAGIDPGETVNTPQGLRCRFNFLHWGQHEGVNGYEFCETVILAGVLHRAHLDIAAAIRGQRGDLTSPTSHELVTQVIKSEVAHCVYQAASRGACRRVDQGKARAMRLWLIHRDPDLHHTLEAVMPGAKWSWQVPRFLKASSLGHGGSEMRGRILESIRNVPQEVLKVSTRALKKQMGLERSESTKKAFTRALQSLDLHVHGWRLEGQSLVRGASAYGFSVS